MNNDRELVRFGIHTNELDRVLRTHAAEPTASRQLKQVISTIQNELHRHHIDKDNLTREDLKRANSQLQRICENLNAASRLLSHLSEPTRRSMNHILAEEIGRSISVDGFLRGGQPVGYEITLRAMDRTDGCSGNNMYEVLESEVRDARVHHASMCGDRVLSGLLDRVKDRIQFYLRVRHEAADGRPPEPYRAIVLDSLALDYEAIFDRRPTTTENGPFIKLAASVLELFGLPTDGLKAAVERQLRRLKRDGKIPS